MQVRQHLGSAGGSDKPRCKAVHGAAHGTCCGPGSSQLRGCKEPRLAPHSLCAPQPFGFPPDRAYIWGAVGFLWGMLLVYTAGATVALRLTNPPAPQPTGGHRDAGGADRWCCARLFGTALDLCVCSCSFKGLGFTGCPASCPRASAWLTRSAGHRKVQGDVEEHLLAPAAPAAHPPPAAVAQQEPAASRSVGAA